MGVEFDAMFDKIDLTRKGFVSSDQLHEFWEAINDAPICIQHIEGAIKQVCGSSGMVTRSRFLDVLTDVERRRATEEQAYWDFQGLDYTGSNRITLRDALLLFKEIHGEKFSLATWKRFLSSRELPGADVYFDEIRFWLCSLPSGTPCSDKDLKQEENRIEMQQMGHAYDEYSEMKTFLEDKDSMDREKVQHEDDTARDARRKLNKWNKQGVEAMLFDDGQDVDEGAVKVKAKEQVALGDLIELLEIKYETLRDKLMLEMARETAAVEDELPEILQQIQRQHKLLLREGGRYSGYLPGGNMMLLASLTGLMGELLQHDREHRRHIEELKVRLRSEGKSQADISAAVQARYERITAGDASCSGILLQLSKRYHQDREVTSTSLRSHDSPTQPANMEYARLLRQLLIMEEDGDFVTMATAVGLAERAMEPRMERSDWDRSRSERLAQIRLQQRKGLKQVRSPHDLLEEDSLKAATLVDLHTMVVKEITRKHFYEREAMIHMLLDKQSMIQLDRARKLSADDRKHQLKSLQNHHQNWKCNPHADKSVLHGILTEALWLRYEERRCELMDSMGTAHIPVDVMQEVLLADLQQRQGLDFENIIHDMQHMSNQAVTVVLKKECGIRVEEHYDNMTYILLGTQDIRAEDQDYIKALDKKYDILRRQVFMMALKEQADWKRLSKEEKQESLKAISKQEKSLRSENKLSKMESLIGPKAKMVPALRSLLGEDKAECDRRKGQHKMDEAPLDPNKVVNLLADLIPRYDNEQEYMLSWLHSPEVKKLSLRMKHMRIVELKMEVCRAKMEEEFEIAALSVGLVERVRDALSHRTSSDAGRQSELSRRRVQQRVRRTIQGGEYHKDPEVSKGEMPKKGDITGLQVTFLHELLKRHCDEREVLLGHLQDESIDDLIEVAATMSQAERQQRLAELLGKRQNLNLTFPGDKEENVSILEEAAALRAVAVKQQLVTEGKSSNMEGITVVILAELQAEQDMELALALQQIENMNEEDIRTCLDREINNRRLETSWNVVTILTRYRGEATDELLLKALDRKYDVLREKLLVDSLRIRIGSDLWEDMAPTERERKLAALDSQAMEMIKMGHVLPSLLGEEFHLPENVNHMMGVCPHVFRNKVKGQLITGNQTNFHMTEDAGGVVSKKGAPVSPLTDLHHRYEEEKLALGRQMKGQTEDYFSETDRQVQLVCYHRESSLASQCQTFSTTATIVGLLERQQSDIKFRLVKDKLRYEKVATSVMVDIQNGRQKTLPVYTSNRQSNMESLDELLVVLENKHQQERELFHRLLTNADRQTDIQQQAAVCTQQQKFDKLTKLKATRQASVLDRKFENLEVLTEATVYKMEDRRDQLTTKTDDITDEALCTSLIADLLEYQNSEAQRLIHELALKNPSDVQEEQDKIMRDQKSNMADNIALVVFSPDLSDGTTETDLIEALKGKYDALKDKLLAEALMKELGESEWGRLSEKDRQKKIFQLKLKEKQLRRAGKVDEANALLEKLLGDQEHLRQLMGDAVEDQRKKLKERLQRRKERLAQGMSKEEVDQLEREEIEKEEEEDKMKKRNILDDLEHRFEQEKNALLQRLKASGDEEERERERQASLARLHRDERLARKEGNFGAAALILGLSEKQDKDLRLTREQERERQEKLAKERLQAARERRRKGIRGDDDDVDDDGVVDTDNPESLQEAIARSMDKKHRQERELFMQLLGDGIGGKHRRAAAAMTEEERDDKMFELSELYKNLLNSEDKDTQEKLNLFKEAAGCITETMMCEALAQERYITDEDLIVSLLADLQEEQKREAQRLLNELENKDLPALQQLHKAFITLNRDDHHDNIATVLLGDRSRLADEGYGTEEEDPEGETSNRNVLKALEQKYDAIKDKLLVEALMKELGEQEWTQLTEKQRQKKLIELKLKERRLRKEGKMDEIANIIGSHLENEKLLDELMDISQKSQRDRLKERLARKKQLVAERTAQGLDTDDATLDAIIEEEEEVEQRERRRNILGELQKNFDGEKDRLMKTLASQKDKMSAERQRQIALAKLKREERLMKKGEKLGEVALIMSNAMEHDKRREEGVAAERERQRAVARERIEARRRKKNQAVLSKEEIEEKLVQDEERAEMEDALQDVEGRSIQEALLTTVEGRQGEELDMLMALLDSASSNKQLALQIHQKPDAEVKSELTRLEQEQRRWRTRSVQAVKELDEAHMTSEDGHKHMVSVAQSRSDLVKLLTDALMFQLEVDRRLLQHSKPDLNEQAVDEELHVALVTDLQEKHSSESRALQALVQKQDDDILHQMKKSQHVACREGWMDNLINTIFHSSSGVRTEEEEEIEESFNSALNEMEEEFQKEKAEAVEKGMYRIRAELEKAEAVEKAKKTAAEGEVIDEEAIIRALMEQHEARKQQMVAEMKAQKEVIMKRVAAQRMAQEQRSYEDLAARALLNQALEHMDKVKVGQQQQRGKQASLLQQKLAERREARKEAKHVKTSLDRENTLDAFDDSKVSSDQTSFKGQTPSPFDSMRREKTVVDVDVSEEQKQALFSQMVREQKNLQSKISEQQRKQELMLKRRLQARQGKHKEEEVAEVFSIGHRQKTNLERSKQDEKDRQLLKMQEKVSKMKERSREPSPGKFKE